MPDGANVSEVHVLEDLRGTLTRFGSEAGAMLEAADREIHQTEEWLRERINYWQQIVQDCRIDVQQAEAALVRCRRSPSNGHDCRTEENVLTQAQGRLREGQRELANTQQWSRAVQQAVAEYQSSARQLSVLLSVDVPRGIATLSRKTDDLQRYFNVQRPDSSTTGPPPSIEKQPQLNYNVCVPKKLTDEAEKQILERLGTLAKTAAKEPGGADFEKAINAFQKSVASRIVCLAGHDSYPPDVALVMTALHLWIQDKGEKWGTYSSGESLRLGASDYAHILPRWPKCNVFVAETVYQSFEQVFRSHPKESIARLASKYPWLLGFGESTRNRANEKYFPYRAADWGAGGVDIPNFRVVRTPEMGDIWSSGRHVGIYLGEYEGRKLYISARSNTNGVFGAGTVQHEKGIQIKFLDASGIYRRYTPQVDK